MEAVEAATIKDTELGDTDLRILSSVTEHRQRGEGATWNEIRAALGWGPPTLSLMWLSLKSDKEAQRAYKGAWKSWWAQHPELPKAKARRRFNQAAFELWRLTSDPLRLRLESLRDRGLLGRAARRLPWTSPVANGTGGCGVPC